MASRIEADPTSTGDPGANKEIKIPRRTVPKFFVTLLLILCIAPISDLRSSTSQLMLSPFSNRSAATPLADSTVAGGIYVVVQPQDQINRVLFFVDDPAMINGVYRTDNKAPFDLVGGSTNGAVVFDTTTLTEGIHTITAQADLLSGTTEVIHANVYVANTWAQITLNQPLLVVNTRIGGSAVKKSVVVDTSDHSNATFSAFSAEAWLSPLPNSGSTPQELLVSIDSNGLSPGGYSTTLNIATDGYLTARLPVIIDARAPDDTTELQFSLLADRSHPMPLDEEVIAGNQYLFVHTDAAITKTEFFIDDPLGQSTPLRSDTSAPFDLAGGSTSAANPFDTTVWPDGHHVLTARIEMATGELRLVHANITIGNTLPVLGFDKSSLVFSVTEGSIPPDQVLTLKTSDGNAAAYSTSIDVPWLSTLPAEGTAPETLIATASAASLPTGTYLGTLSAVATGYLSARIPVTLSINPKAAPHQVVFSTVANRTNPLDLNGAIVAGSIYIYASPATDISRVEFHMDDPQMASGPSAVDNNAPFDYAGGNSTTANPLNTTVLSDGSHILATRIILKTGATEDLYAGFTVGNVSPVITTNLSRLELAVDLRQGTGTVPLSVSTSNGSVASVTIQDLASWLVFSPANGATPLSTNANVTATGLLPGAYNSVVSITATGYQSAILPFYLTVTDLDKPPVAVPGGPYVGNINSPIIFDGTGSYDPDIEPITYAWNFGDGSSGSGAKPSYSYTNAGNYTVTLVVSDGYKQSPPATTSVHVNHPPVANAGADFSVNENTTATLDGSQSTDSDGNIAQYLWLQTGGPAVTLTNASSSIAHFTAPEVTADTMAQFQLTVTDNTGASAQDSVAVTIRQVNKPPVISSIQANPPTLLDNETSQLSVLAYDPDPGTNLTYHWTVPAGAGSLSNSNVANPVYTPPDVAAEQSFTLSVTVSDGTASTSATVTLTVNNAMPAGGLIPPGDLSGVLGSGDYILDGDYYINGWLTIPSTATLTIKPGSRLFFHWWSGMEVSGRLSAEGTADQRILFTSADSTGHFFQPPSTPTPGEWYGVIFGDTAGGSTMSYLTLEWSRTAITNIGADLTIDHCKLENHKTDGLLIYGYGTTTITQGIISNSVISGTNYQGVGLSLFDAAPQVTGTTITNHFVGIYIDGKDANAVIKNGNDIYGNKMGIVIGWYDDSANYPDQTFPAPQPIITQNNIHDNRQFSWLDPINFAPSSMWLGSNFDMSAAVLHMENNWWGSNRLGDITRTIADNTMYWSYPQVKYVPFLDAPYPQGKSVQINYLTGNISDDHPLSPNTTYEIAGTVTIAAGTTLTVPEGVTMLFYQGARFDIAGNLIVNGSDGSPVHFTTAEDVSYYRANAGYANFWSGLMVANGGRADIQHAVIEWAAYGVYVTNATAVIRNSVLKSNYYGLRAGSQAVVTLAPGNIVTYNNIGIRASGTYTAGNDPILKVNGNDIYNNKQSAIYADYYSYSNSTPIDATGNWWGTANSVDIDNVIYDQKDHHLNPTVNYSGYRNEVLVSRLEGTIASDKSLITDIPYWVMADTVVPSGVTLALRNGVRLQFLDNTGLTVAGSLQTSSPENLPVVLTSDNPAPSKGIWKGAFVSGSVSIDSTDILWADKGLNFSQGGGQVSHTTIKRTHQAIRVSGGSSPQIGPQNILLLNDYGIYAQGGGSDPKPVVHGNNLIYNQIANYYATGFTNTGTILDASGNWWGSSGTGDIENSVHHALDDTTAPFVNTGASLTQSAVIKPLLSPDYNLNLRSGVWYDVENSLEILLGVKLTVAEGATLRFSPSNSMLVSQGTVDIQGDAEAPVTLTSNGSAPAKGSWQGIIFSTPAYNTSSTIRHADIRYAATGISVAEAGYTPPSAANPGLQFNNNRISDFSQSGIAIAVDSYATILGNDIVNNDHTGTGIYLKNSSPLISGNHLHGTAAGIYLDGSNAQIKSYPSIKDGNEFENNIVGMHIEGNHAFATNPAPAINNNNFHDNVNYHLSSHGYGGLTPSGEFIDAQNNWWGTVNLRLVRNRILDINYPDASTIDQSEPTVVFQPYLDAAWPQGSVFTADTNLSGTITTDTNLLAGLDYTVSGSLTLASGATLTIPAGTSLNFAPGAQLLVYGTLLAPGESYLPVTFTGNGTGDLWGGIVIYGSANIEHAIVEHANTGITFYNATGHLRDSLIDLNQIGVRIYGKSTPLLRENNTITNNAIGILVEGTGNSDENPTPIIRGNAIHANAQYNLQTKNFFAGQTASVYAKFNWLGSAQNSAIESTLEHRIDNSSLPLVDYIPYLDDLDGRALTPVINDTLTGTVDGTQLAPGTTYLLHDNIVITGGLSPNIVFRSDTGVGVTLDPQAFAIAASELYPVVFTSLQQVKLLNGTYDYSRSWTGLHINVDNAQQGANLHGVFVEYAENGVYIESQVSYTDSYTTRWFASDSVQIADSLVRRNKQGILIHEASPNIVGSTISDNETGIRIESISSPKISEGNKISHNGVGIHIDGYGGMQKFIPPPSDAYASIWPAIKYSMEAAPTINGNEFRDNIHYSMVATNFNASRLSHTRQNVNGSGILSIPTLRIDASRNIWNQTDPTLIAKSIFDRGDDSGLNVWVDYSNYLDAFGGNAQKADELSGPISGANLSPGQVYRVIGDIAFSGDLPIGTTFEFVDGYAIDIYGDASVTGMPDNPVVFKPALASGKNGWLDIHLTGKVLVGYDFLNNRNIYRDYAVTVDYLNLSSADIGIRVTSGEYIEDLGSSGNSELIATYVRCDTVDIAHTRIDDANIGIWSSHSSPKINANYISRSVIGLLATSIASPEVANNTIIDNELGIFVNSADSTLLPVYTHIWNPTIEGWDTIQSGFTYTDAQPRVNANRIANNSQYNFVATHYHDRTVITPLYQGLAPATMVTELDAKGNWWGSIDPTKISESIFDFAENPRTSPWVNYLNFLNEDMNEAAGNYLAGTVGAAQITAGQTYQVIGNTVLNVNNLPAGTRFEVVDSYSISIAGENIGSAEPGAAPVVFTSGKPNPSPGDWPGLKVLDYTYIKYIGNTPVPYSTVLNNVIVEYADIGIYVYRPVYEYAGFTDHGVAHPSINASTLRNNNTGTKIRLAYANFNNNSIHDNTIGMFTALKAGVNGAGNTLTHNAYGIYLDGEGGQQVFLDNNQSIWVNSYLSLKSGAILENQYNIVSQHFYPGSPDAKTSYLDFQPINLQNNWWGTTDAQSIARTIYDRADGIQDAPWIDFGHWLDENANATTSELLFHVLNLAKPDIAYYAVSNLIAAYPVLIPNGVRILFFPGTRLDADCPIHTFASNTADHPVIFDSANTAPAAGDWQGIALHNFADCGYDVDVLQPFNFRHQFKYITVRHANQALTLSGGAAVGVEDSQLLDNRVGMVLTGGFIPADPYATCTDLNGTPVCPPEKNDQYLTHLDSNASVTHTRFAGNNDKAVRVENYADPLKVLDFKENYWDSPVLSDINAVIHDSLDDPRAAIVAIAPWRLDAAGTALSPYRSLGGRVSDALTPLTDTSAPYLVVGDTEVSLGNSFTVPAGTQLHFNSGRALRNHGHLTLAGSDAAPVTLTSAQVNKKANDWSGLLTTGPGALTEAGYTVVEYAADALAFAAGAGGTVDHATLRRNQNGLAVRGGAASGDLTQDSHPVMHSSNLYDNGNYQVDARDFADPATVLDATGNWWGGNDPAVIDRDIYDHQDDARSPTVAWQDTRLSAPTTALPHQIAITQPANGIATSDAVLTVRGVIDAQLTSAFTVNGYGVTLQGNTFRATVPLSIGVNTITAQAVSPQGQVAEDAISVTRLDTGVISLTAIPATGYDPLPVTFTINNATGKSITKLAVDYNGNGVIDETFTDAVTFNHTYVDGGQFNAVAYVTDSAGTTYLASTAISVQRHADQPLLSDLSFVSPLNQAMIAGDTILVQGRYAGPDQATITLNGQPVLRYQDRWYVNNVHLLPGANTLTARAVSDDGQTAETIITVTSTAVSPVTVAIDHESGLIPLTVNLSINNPGNLPLNHVSVDFDGDGTFEIDTSDLSMPLTHTFDQPGDAVMTVTVSDGNGGSYVNKLAVVAEQSGEQLDTAFRALYNGMLAALAQGDIDGATSFIDGDERPYYRQLFLDLATTNDLAVLATQLGTLESGVIGDGWAEYIIGREENGMQKGFGIHFVRESDGTWEIGGF